MSGGRDQTREWLQDADREALYIAEDRMVLPSGDGPIRIWRGAKREHASGLSWTTDREQACAFARRTGGQVFSAEIARTEILAAFEHEREIVCAPASFAGDGLPR